MFRKLIINIGSGYLLKVLQIICGLITVPLLVSKDGLGVEGFGHLAVALSLAAMLSMLFDGLRLVASKRIGYDTARLFSGVKKYSIYFFVTSLLPVAIFLLFYKELFIFSNISFYSAELALLLVIFFLLEQLLYVAEQYFHTQFKTFLINISNGLEAITRLAGIFFIFQDGNGTVNHYFMLFVSTYSVKLLVFWFFIAKNNVEKTLENPVQDKYLLNNYLIESLPLSLKGSVIYLVFRLSVIFTNKYLSAETAAVFAIIFVTLRGYLTQLFVTVFRPMVIPMLSKISICDLQSSSKKKYADIIACYEGIVLFFIFLISALTILWLPLWLGEQFLTYRSVIALGVMILGIECATSLKSLTLISQGHGNELTIYSVACCVVYALIFISQQYLGWLTLDSFVIAIGIYIFLYNVISVNMITRGRLFSDVRTALAIIVVTVASALLYSHESLFKNYSAYFASFILISIVAVAFVVIYYKAFYELKCLMQNR